MSVLRRAGLAVLLAVAVWHGGRAGWIAAKAQLAQYLLGRAWQRAQAGEGNVPPWPWADTHPIARLRVPGRHVDLFVLAGASGRTLAFGPGHLTGSPLPGQEGNAVLSGHRDTHFAFLRDLVVGDDLLVEDREGRSHRYRVSGLQIVDQHDVWVTAATNDTRLTLVTCYPFAAVRPGGPLRYVVTARLVAGTRSSHTAAASAWRRREHRALSAITQ